MLHKLRPARTQAQDCSVVLDLDDLMVKPVGFQLKGRTYIVKPVSTETFLRLADILGEIQTMVQGIAKGDKIHDADIYQAYYRYISVLCPEFTLETLKGMALPQVHGVVNLIIKHATGQPLNMDDFVEKKKMAKKPA